MTEPTTQTLVERLRVHKDLSLCHEAAAALEAQAREIDRLQVEAEQLRKGHFDASETASVLRAELNQEKTIVKSWLRANCPDGWIDDMRKDRDTLKAELAAIRAVPVADVNSGLVEALEQIVQVHDMYCEHHKGVSEHSRELAGIAAAALSTARTQQAQKGGE